MWRAMAEAGSMLNERMAELGDNPFTQLNHLLADIAPAAGFNPIALSIGEPQHAPPVFLTQVLASCGDLWNRYPPIKGTYEFRSAVVDWLNTRFGIPSGRLHPDRHILPLCGSKEGLYLAAGMLVPAEKRGKRPVVLIPSPFYQVYRGAAIMSGAEVVAVPATKETGFLPDFQSLSPEILERTALAFLCNPANPQGTIGSAAYLDETIALARRYEFTLAVDECYSEIWDTAPPPGALAAANRSGSFERVLVFNSLSKRSNAAGLRAAFVAGDEHLIEAFLTLRSYGGSQMPLPVQAAAAALWRDEAHVEENRARYRSKIDAAARVLGGHFEFYRPPGGFFLWLEVGDSERAAAALWREAAVRVLPGKYLALEQPDGRNPGANYLRLALVHDDAVIEEAATRIRRVL